MRTVTALLAALLLTSCSVADDRPACEGASPGADHVRVWSDEAQACVVMPVCYSAGCQ